MKGLIRWGFLAGVVLAVRIGVDGSIISLVLQF